jgi:hypothetical protein
LQAGCFGINTGATTLETFVGLKEFTANPRYRLQRQESLGNLADAPIDAPIVDLIVGLNRLPYCFTLQSCFGHFNCSGRQESHTVELLPAGAAEFEVEYRIAYVAFCIENSRMGGRLYEALRKIADIDPDTVQFGCAEWFWDRQINSYVLQVEPDRFKHKDRAILGYREALHIEKIRDEFFARLYQLVEDAEKLTG